MAELVESQNEQSWFIASRWQEFDGELRSALLRGILVTLFYAVQLLHHLSLEQPSESERNFHRLVTLVAVAWLFSSMAVLISLRGGFMPPALKYLTTAGDIALTTLLAIFGQGAQSPLTYAYFLILVLTALRFRIGLVWFATAGSMLAYVLLVGSSDPTWFDSQHETPLLTQAIVLLSLVSTGIILDQVVRSSRSMANAYRERASTERLGAQS